MCSGAAWGSLGNPLGQAGQDPVGRACPTTPAAEQGSPGHGAPPGDGLGPQPRGGPGSAGPRAGLGRAGGSGDPGPAAWLGQGLRPGGAGMGSWAIGWVEKAPGAGRGIGALKAWTLLLFEKEGSNQRQTTFLLKKDKGVAV